MSFSISSFTNSFISSLNLNPATQAAASAALSPAISSAVSNTLTQAVGTAVNQATQQLQQENGMPKFLQDEIKGIVDKAVEGLLKPNVPVGDANTVKDTAGSALDNFIKLLTQSIVDAVRNAVQNGSGGEGTSGTGGTGSGGKTSGGSWMQAIAEAMGKAMGEKAKNLVILSDKIASLSGTVNGTGQKPADGAGTTDEAAKRTEGDKAEAAAETQRLNAQFQATAQEFNLLQTTFSTAMKTIGEGMASVARKQ